MYRDFAYHGGLFCFGFVTNWYINHMAHHLLGKPLVEHSPDTFSKNWVWQLHARQPGHAASTTGARPQWDKIEVPFYSAGNWSGMGLHLRGNTEAFVRRLRNIKSCASTPARITTRSMPRKRARTSCAFSTTG